MKIHKYILKQIIPFIVFVSSLSFLSCESPVVPIEDENPSIVYEFSGGIFAYHDKISIDKNGLATYHTIYPILQLQLTTEEHKQIKSYLTGFENYQNSYLGGCIDDFHYKLSLNTSNREKTVEFDGCFIDKNSELKQLVELISIFVKLRDRIFNEKAAWFGLIYSFTINKAVFSQNDEIIFTCTIENPTNSERIIYFQNKYKIFFRVNNQSNNPLIQLENVNSLIVEKDTTQSSKIILTPGKKTEITYSWNQSFTTNDGTHYNQLPYDRYYVVVFLLGGMNKDRGYPFKDFTFEIK